MDGYTRIKNLYLEGICKDLSLKRIVTFLMKKSNMNDFYLNEDKNLEEMMKFIHNKAKEQAVNNVAVLEDETVYELAITYFTQSNEELGLVTTPKVTTAIPKPKEEANSQLTLGI